MIGVVQVTVNTIFVCQNTKNLSQPEHFYSTDHTRRHRCPPSTIAICIVPLARTQSCEEATIYPSTTHLLIRNPNGNAELYEARIWSPRR